MRQLIVILILGCLLLPAPDAQGFECTNAGEPFSDPDDSGINTATACGPRAVASGTSGSIAVGWTTTASGNQSTAIGSEAVSEGLVSVALGYSADAVGERSIALGSFLLAGGESSIAIGTSANASGLYGIALGRSSEASMGMGIAVGSAAQSLGMGSIAVGNDTDAMTNESIALGAGASATGTSSTSLGRQSSAAGNFSLAVGPSAEATGNISVALGIGAETTNAAAFSTALGVFAFAEQPNTVVIGSVPGINDASVYNNVGMGTTNPQAALHLQRNNGTAEIFVQETSASVAPRTLFTLANRGNTKFEVVNTDAANSWAFTNSGIDFRMSLQDSGVVEFRVDNTGDAYLEGVLWTNSDRNDKTDITPVNAQEVLDKVAHLPIAEWAYKESPESRHIGPMAQDFHAAFATGTSDKKITTLDTSGVALASIQALAKQNRDLRAELAVQKADVEALKALVLQLMPQTAQN